MKNLDTSIANQSILDESFSNARGSEEPTMTVSQSPTNPSPATTVSLPSGFVLKPIVNTPLVYEGKKSTVGQVVAAMPKTVTQSTASSSSTDNGNQFSLGGGYGGGYGGGASESSDDDSSKKEGLDKTIFGMKPIIAYVLGAGALAFVYFKFIKK